MWSAGQVTGDTLYCEEGYTEWQHLGVLAEALEPQEQPPPQQPTSRAGFNKPLVITGVVSGSLGHYPDSAAVLSPDSKPETTIKQPTPPQKTDIQPASSVNSQPPTRVAVAD